jgi:hypothetical protein
LPRRPEREYLTLAHGWFRRWLRKVWELRGGGLYALGFAATFLYLEIRELFLDDIPAFFALESYTFGPLLRLGIDFLIDTIMNTVAAFLWPLTVIQWWPPIGAIALLLAFLIFPSYMKPTVERWLFHDADDPRKPDEPPESRD